MDDPEYLAARLEEIISDASSPQMAAKLIIGQLPSLLFQEGWEPPDKTLRVHQRIIKWMSSTRNIPDHHLNRDVLQSHLTELADIINDR